jgi:hypothetical protein
MIDIIVNNFPVVERGQYGDAGAVVIVFRPRRNPNKTESPIVPPSARDVRAGEV